MSVTRIVTDDPTLASRYLADQLAEDERAAFEERLLTDPQALRELEATARLKLSLQKLRRSGQLANLMEKRQPDGRWLFAVAATVAALIVGIGVLRWTGNTSPMLAAELSALVDSSGNPLHPGNTYAVFHTRATARNITVELPASRQAIQLRILPDTEAPQTATYRASLQRLANAGRASSATTIDELRPAADGFVSIFIDSRQLLPGDYELSISSAADGGVATTFALNVIPAR